MVEWNYNCPSEHLPKQQALLHRRNSMPMCENGPGRAGGCREGAVVANAVNDERPQVAGPEGPCMGAWAGPGAAPSALSLHWLPYLLFQFHKFGCLIRAYPPAVGRTSSDQVLSLNQVQSAKCDPAVKSR